MKMYHRLSYCFLISLLALSGCTDLGAGSFQLQLEWEDEPPEFSQPVYAFGRIEELAGDGDSNRVLGTAGPSEYKTKEGARLSFTQIPNGIDRVAIVELREVDNLDARILYYGKSKPFSLKAGETTIVDVLLKLSRTPGVPHVLPEPRARGVWIETPGDFGVVGTGTVSLVLTTDTGISAEISNIAGFPEGATETRSLEIEATDIEVTDSFRAWRVNWDLNLKLEDQCVESNDCARRVYVRFVDEHGYKSGVHSALAFLDTRAPDIVPDTEGLVLIPGANNELFSVEAVKDGTTARLSFALNELLPENRVPTVRAVFGDKNLDFVKIGGSGSLFIYEHRLDAPFSGALDGEYVFMVTAQDRVGNTKTSSLATTFTVDTTAPPTPDTANLIYERVPWGEEKSGTEFGPSFTVKGRVDTSFVGHHVLILDSQNREVGRAAQLVADTGEVGLINLSLADRPVVRIRLVDSAGNASAAGTIKNVVWTASLKGKLAGNTADNPHRLEVTPEFEEILLQAQGTESSQDMIAAAGTSGSTVAEFSSVPAWKQWSQPSSLPVNRAWHAMAYDVARGRIVLFGGETESGSIYGDTWEWDGNDWLERTPPNSPPNRSYHAMAYDAARGRVVLFGGANGLSVYDDTWEWDGNYWTQRSPANTPSDRFGHTMVYDSARARIVLVGGSQTNGTPGTIYDVWEWDGNDWIPRISSTRPPNRLDHAMAYDAARERVVLFGGGFGASNSLSDTWEWDGNDWLERTPSVSPAVRVQHRMAYDARRGRIILFGGLGGSSGVFNDVWEWDGSAWEEKMPSSMGRTGSQPSRRAAHAMTYDRLRKELLIFGGDGVIGGELQDTWSWDGELWTELRASPGGLIGSVEDVPSSRAGHAMAYDAARDRTVLFGGGAHFAAVKSDTWEWDGRKWTRIQTFPVFPPARTEHAMVYDAGRNRILMFGGKDSSSSSSVDYQDTWQWDGTAWSELVPTGRSPPARSGHAMAYDLARDRTVLFGGLEWQETWGGPTSVAYGDTWEWDGNVWSEQTSASQPSPRSLHSLSYDSRRARILLFGGDVDNNGNGVSSRDIWEWDGSDWFDRTPANLGAAIQSGLVWPRERHSHKTVYDSARGRMILYGGDHFSNTTAQQSLTWEWDGSEWFDRPVRNQPPRRSQHAMAYDTARETIVMFGGVMGPDQVQETWTLGSGFDLRGGALFHVDWASAFGETADINRISGMAIVGGRGYDRADTAVAGADILGWNGPLAAWLPLASTTADRNAPTRLAFTTTTTPQAYHLVDGNDEIHLRFQSTSGAGGTDDTGGISLDYLQVTVHYTIGSGDNPSCGDGIIHAHAAEACDDGNATNGDGCSSACTRETGWSCSGEPSTCVVCGNGNIEGSETCDDGNATNGDGCNEVCSVEYNYTCTGVPSVCSN